MSFPFVTFVGAEWKSGKLVYKRYASLYFLAFTDPEDNELLTLEIVCLLWFSMLLIVSLLCRADSPLG